MQQIQVNENQAGQRVDRFLKKFFPEAPLSFIFKSIRTNKIKVNGKRPKPENILKKGDEVKLFFTDEQLKFTEKPIQKTPNIYGTKFYKNNLNVAYEDSDLLVLNKSAEIAVHPGTKNFTGQTLLDVAQSYIKHKKETQKEEASSVVALAHRLDKETSGLVILTKNEFASREINAMIRAKTIEKKYLALVSGHLINKKGTIKVGLLRTEGKKRTTKIITSKNDFAKEAITHYQVKKEYRNFSLVEIKLETGRMHQIRVHFASLKHPLIGDKNYGDFKVNREIEKQYGLKRHFLHAYELTFNHPRSGKKMILKTELPEDLNDFLNKIQ